MSKSSDNYHGIGILLICLAPIVGAFFPIVFKNWKNTIHFFTAYAAGLLLGFALIHLLPDAIDEIPAIDSVNENYPIATLLVGCTVLLLLTVATFVPYISEWIVVLMTKSGVKFSNALIDVMGFWPGLAIHGIFEGLAFGVLTGEATDWVGIAVLFLHKCVEFNALGTFLVRLELSQLNYWILNAVCEIPCLIGFIVAWKTSSESEDATGYLTAFAAGTFLYLSLVNLLPEAMNFNKQGSGCNCCGIPIGEVGNNKESCAVCNVELGEESQKPTQSSTNLLSEEFQFKVRGYIGVGLGFATFALLQLKDN